jgi:hypothetical protein
MDCGQSREAIPELAAGGAGDEARAALLEHLKLCPACAREEADVRGLLDSLRDLPAEDPSPAVWAAIERGVKEDVGTRSVPAAARFTRILRYIHWPTAAAAAITLCVGATLLYVSSSRTSLVRPLPTPPVGVSHLSPAPGARLAFVGNCDRPIVERPYYYLPSRKRSHFRVEGGGVRIWHMSGTSIYVDRDAEIVVEDPYIELIGGAVVVDDSEQPSAKRITVGTPVGHVTPVGTRFFVSHNGGTTVGVEEGKVRLETGAGAIDVPTGFVGRAEGRASVPSAVRDVASILEIQRIRESAAPSGLRLAVTLAPPAQATGNIRFTARVEKVPGVGPAAMDVASVAGGGAYLTCVADDAAGVVLDPRRLAERSGGGAARGLAHVAADAPYIIEGELTPEESGLARGAARLMMTYVARRPDGHPSAWSGQLASPLISIPQPAEAR